MISAVVLTRNNEHDIEKVMNQLAFCSEVIIVDNHSQDKTCELAKRTGARIEQIDSDSFADRRNAGDSIAQHDWILHIDTDELLSEALISEIKEVTQKKESSVYAIPRVDVFWGNELKYGDLRSAYNQGIVRLYRKGSGQWQGDVHEKYITNKRVVKIKNAIQHPSHKNVSDFLRSINEYSSLRANELYKQGIESHVYSIVLYPCAKFVYLFFIQQGFRDGQPGFVYAYMMSFYSFLVRGKLYVMQNKGGKD